MPQPLCRSLKDLFDLSRVGIEGNLDLYRGYVVEDVKLDTIAREELCRSVATFGVSLIATAFVITAGYLPIPAFLILPLPLTIAAVVAYVLVWYRRKEGLIDPNPIRILHHVLQSGEQQEERAKRRRTLADKVTDGVLAVAIFLIYLYASRAYSINQILWLPVLLIIGMFLARIVFTDGGEHRITLTRSVVFYLLAAGIVLLRRLALGYPVIPTLQGVILVGIITFPILYVWERRRGQEVVD